MPRNSKLTALVLKDKGFFSAIPIILIIITLGGGSLLLLAAPLQAAPAHTGLPDRQTAVASALDWLHSQQSEDGSVGGIGNSCEAVWVIAQAGDHPDGPAWTPVDTSAWDACVRDLPVFLALRDPGRIAKVLRAAVAVDANPRDVNGVDLIGILEEQYDPATGLYHPTSLFRHSLAVLALHEAGRPIPPKVLTTLIAQQLGDGSWGWPVDPTPGDGNPATGDLDTTGLVLTTLHVLGVSPNHSAVARAVAFIMQSQHADAGWGRDNISNSDATALAMVGLLHAGWDPTSDRFQKNGADPLTLLLSFQEASGAFRWRQDIPGSLMRSTFDAIPALVTSYPSDTAKPVSLYLPFTAAVSSIVDSP